MDYNTLKVAELKDLLTERGLPVKGVKKDLVQRLEEDDKAKSSKAEEMETDKSEEKSDKSEEDNKEQVKSEEKSEEKNQEQKEKIEDVSNSKKDPESNENPSANVEMNIEKDKEETKSADTRKMSKEKEENEAVEGGRDSDNKKKAEEDQGSSKRQRTWVSANTQANPANHESRGVISTESLKMIQKELTSEPPKPRSRTNSTSTEKPDAHAKREVSPALNPESSTLLIKGFVRPFSNPAVKEYLTQNGGCEISFLWMDKIKTHCYVVYESRSDAIKNRDRIHGGVWPEGTGKPLTADFFPDDKISTIPLAEGNIIFKKDSAEIRKIPSSSSSNQAASNAVEAREGSDSGDKGKAKDQETPKPAGKSLDELFRKTKAKPALYFLPLTEEQIKVKLDRKKMEVEKADEQREQRAKEREERNKEREEQRKKRSDGSRSPKRNKSKSRSRSRDRSNSRSRSRSRSDDSDGDDRDKGKNNGKRRSSMDVDEKKD